MRRICFRAVGAVWPGNFYPGLLAGAIAFAPLALGFPVSARVTRVQSVRLSKGMVKTSRGINKAFPLPMYQVFEANGIINEKWMIKKIIP